MIWATRESGRYRRADWWSSSPRFAAAAKLMAMVILNSQPVMPARAMTITSLLFCKTARATRLNGPTVPRGHWCDALRRAGNAARPWP
jgi:hypothetical protein